SATSSPTRRSASGYTDMAAHAVITSRVNRFTSGTAVSLGVKDAARTARGLVDTTIVLTTLPADLGSSKGAPHPTERDRLAWSPRLDRPYEALRLGRVSPVGVKEAKCRPPTPSWPGPNGSTANPISFPSLRRLSHGVTATS